MIFISSLIFHLSSLKREKRFTLIELLVVIAIIAILAGMLLPALGGVKESGKMISCMNNQNQLGKILGMYFNDFDDYFPWQTRIDGDPSKGVNASHLWSLVASGSYNPSPLAVYIDQGKNNGCTRIAAFEDYPSGLRRGSFLCPGVTEANLNFQRIDKNVNIPSVDGTVRTFLSLSFNESLCNNTTRKSDPPSGYGKPFGVKMSKTRNRNSLVLFADGSGNGAATYYCKWHPDLNDLNHGYKMVPARHKGGANFFYGDLHGEFLKWEVFPSHKHGYNYKTYWIPDD